MRKLVLILAVVLGASSARAANVGVPALTLIPTGSNNTVDVTIDTAFAAIEAADITFLFNQGIATPDNPVVMGSDFVAAGCIQITNTSTPGQITVSIGCTTPVTTPSPIILFTMTFNAVSVGLTNLTFDECVLNEGSEACNPTSGQLQVVGNTPTNTVTATVTNTATQTNTATGTLTPSSTATVTNTRTATATRTATNTGVATSTFTPTWTSGPTRTFTETEVPCVPATTTPTGPTVTVTLTPSVTNTPGSTNTPAATGTVTQTPTPAEVQQGQLFMVVQTLPDDPSEGPTSIEGFASDVFSLQIPVGIRIRNMYAICTNGPGTGKTVDLKFKKNYVDITGGNCTMTGAGLGAGVNTCNASFANTTAFDIAAGDRITLNATQNVGSATMAICRVTSYYTLAGDSGAAPALIYGGPRGVGSLGPDTYYCGPYNNNSTNPSVAYACVSTDPIETTFVLPAAGTLSGFAVRASGWSGDGTFTVMTDGATVATDLTGALNSGTLNFTDTTCSSNCSIQAAEKVNVQMVQATAATGSNRYQKWALSIAGVGAVFWNSSPSTLPTDVYSGPWLGFNADPPTPVAFLAPVARASTAKNLACCVGGATTAAVVGTLYKSTDGTTMSATALTCSVPAGAGSCCTDAVNTVTYAAGDSLIFGNVSASSQATSQIRCAVEMVP